MLIHGFSPVNARLLITCETAFYAIINVHVTDPASMTLSWTPSFVAKDVSLYLAIYVIDTLNATSYYWPEVQLCACNDPKKCLFDSSLTRWEERKLCSFVCCIYHKCSGNIVSIEHTCIHERSHDVVLGVTWLLTLAHFAADAL